MKHKTIRVVIDTNLWISFLIRKDFQYLDSLFLSEKLIVLFSNELIDEFVSVVKRPKFKKYFNPLDVEKLIILFDNYGEIINISSRVELCRDGKDNFLLSLSKDGNADFLLTGDNDLLVLKEIEKTKIITINEFQNTNRKK